jgi:2-amino-4-hydroxy-6-hydroxymethyldihydropteridine diphosphokinase
MIFDTDGLFDGGLKHICLMNDGIFILLGSNQGDRLKNLSEARQAISGFPSVIVKTSGIYQTQAWGNENQDDFYNQVVEISTFLLPAELLIKIQEAEVSLGRIRTEKWGPRIIDIDILFFNNAVIETPSLVIPHPGIPDRKFTLIPLNEIAPDFFHPVLHKKIGTLLQECSDRLDVNRI